MSNQIEQIKRELADRPTKQRVFELIEYVEAAENFYFPSKRTVDEMEAEYQKLKAARRKLGLE